MEDHLIIVFLFQVSHAQKYLEGNKDLVPETVFMANGWILFHSLRSIYSVRIDCPLITPRGSTNSLSQFQWRWSTDVVPRDHKST